MENINKYPLVKHKHDDSTGAMGSVMNEFVLVFFHSCFSSVNLNVSSSYSLLSIFPYTEDDDDVLSSFDDDDVAVIAEITLSSKNIWHKYVLIISWNYKCVTTGYLGYIVEPGNNNTIIKYIKLSCHNEFITSGKP